MCSTEPKIKKRNHFIGRWKNRKTRRKLQSSDYEAEAIALQQSNSFTMKFSARAIINSGAFATTYSQDTKET